MVPPMPPATALRPKSVRASRTRAAAPRGDKRDLILRDVIAQGQAAGVVRPGINPTLAAKMLFGALDEMATNWMLSHRRSSLDGVADAVVDVFVHGIGAPATQGGPRP